MSPDETRRLIEAAKGALAGEPDGRWFECPTCGGAGCLTDAICCGNPTDWGECCSNPAQGQVQCDTCGGAGQVPAGEPENNHDR